MMEIIPTKQSFRHYLFFWSGQLFSLFGSSIVQFAIIWWITIETGNPIFLAIASTLYILSSVIVLPFAGVLSDKLNKKQLILIADSSQVVATLILILLFAMNIVNVYLVFVIISVRSIFQAIHLPTVNSIIPAMVPKDKLTRINGINYLFTGLVELTAPFVGAALLFIFAVYQVFWLDLITFAIAVIPLLSIKIPSVHDVNKEPDKSFIKEFRIGFRTLRIIPGLFIIIILSMFQNFLTRPILSLMSFYVYVIHSGSALDFAIVMGLMQGSMIIGALYTSIKKTWKHQISAYFLGLIIINVGYLMFAFVPIGFILMIGVSAAVFGLCFPIVNSLYQTMVQTVVPKDKIGRITSIDFALSLAITPIASLASGFLAEAFGLTTLILYCAIISIILTVPVWNLFVRRKINYQDENFIQTTKIRLEEMNGVKKDGRISY
ncbi:MAG: MFS transporter [Candidatus Hermodarchaeota archaeon]